MVSSDSPCMHWFCCSTHLKLGKKQHFSKIVHVCFEVHMKLEGLWQSLSHQHEVWIIPKVWGQILCNFPNFAIKYNIAWKLPCFQKLIFAAEPLFGGILGKSFYDRKLLLPTALTLVKTHFLCKLPMMSYSAKSFEPHWTSCEKHFICFRCFICFCALIHQLADN